MLHPESHLVTEKNGPRPAGPAGECFYCKEPIGNLHKPECVCRLRTIVVKATVEYVVVVPEDWDRGNFEFHHNLSTWCANNFIDELEQPEGRCLCGAVQFEYLREATEGEELEWELKMLEDCGE